MIVVGLAGPKGSGKSTVSAHLARVYGASVFAFADPLKEIILKGFDVPRECLYGTQEQKEAIIPGLGLSGRDLMQKVGTGVRKTLGGAFWARRTVTDVIASCARFSVVEDVRYLSEASVLRLRPDDRFEEISKVVIWKLDHPWLVPSDGHESETEWREIREDHRIATSTKNVDALLLEVDRACLKFGITPALSSIEAP